MKLIPALALLAPLFAAISGCAPNYMWKHSSHADRAQFDRDVAQCQYEAVAATGSYSSGPTRRTYSGAISQGISDGIELGTRQRDIAILCMKARGYSQHPIDGTVLPSGSAEAAKAMGDF